MVGCAVDCMIFARKAKLVLGGIDTDPGIPPGDAAEAITGIGRFCVI